MSIVRPQGLLVGAASISADLGEVSEIARHISIGVKNAKAIAARAGDQARGFQPITDFINEMALEIIRLVGAIDIAALNVTRIATTHSRSLDVYDRVNDVLCSEEPIRYKHQLKDVVKNLEDNVDIIRQALRKQARELDLLLGEIMQKVKAAQVIASSSRVEAARAADYRQNLEGVAANLESETNKIKERVSRCQNRLQGIIGTLE
jgi:hypothetical protein